MIRFNVQFLLASCPLWKLQLKRALPGPIDRPLETLTSVHRSFISISFTSMIPPPVQTLSASSKSILCICNVCMICMGWHGGVLLSTSSTSNRTFNGTFEGWMGLKSFANTSAFSKRSATSMAQMPVPVPKSSTRGRRTPKPASCRRAATGAVKRFPPRSMRKMWWNWEKPRQLVK